MSEHNAEIDVLTTDCTEWAVQCHDRNGGLFTGRAFTTREQAEQSGKRLTRINGADWWLIQRRRVVTVETEQWTRVTPPAVGDAS